MDRLWTYWISHRLRLCGYLGSQIIRGGDGVFFDIVTRSQNSSKNTDLWIFNQLPGVRGSLQNARKVSLQNARSGSLQNAIKKRKRITTVWFLTHALSIAHASVCLTDVQVSLFMLCVCTHVACYRRTVCQCACMFQGTYLQWFLTHEGLGCTDIVDLAHMFDATQDVGLGLGQEKSRWYFCRSAQTR